MPGSSPLTRGKQSVDRRGGPPRGLIPAHAGKTPWPPGLRERVRAHPRSRGENPLAAWLEGACEGSSPLTRGKPLDLGAESRFERLIPAHAGKTLVADTAQVAGTAHPRSRGENGRAAAADFHTNGSSPLTRGKPAPDAIVQEGGGLIPAHAGKTRLRS